MVVFCLLFAWIGYCMGTKFYDNPKVKEALEKMTIGLKQKKYKM
jgi:hypothetical protein